MAKFLLLDGHAKSFTPGSTWTADSNVVLQPINPVTWNGLCTTHLNDYQ